MKTMNARNEKRYRILGNGKNYYVEVLTETLKGYLWKKLKDNNDNTILFDTLEKAEEYVQGLKGLSYDRYSVIKEL